MRVRRSISASASVLALATISSASCLARSSSASRSLSADFAFASYSAFSASASLRSDSASASWSRISAILSSSASAIAPRHLLPDQQREDDQHRERDPAARVEPERSRLCASGCSAACRRRSAAQTLNSAFTASAASFLIDLDAGEPLRPFPASRRRRRPRSPTRAECKRVADLAPRRIRPSALILSAAAWTFASVSRALACLASCAIRAASARAASIRARHAASVSSAAARAACAASRSPAICLLARVDRRLDLRHHSAGDHEEDEAERDRQPEELRAEDFGKLR